MLKPFSRVYTFIIFSFLLLLSLLGCSPQVTATFESTAASEPTATEVEFVPEPPRNSREMVIFSFEEDGYAHLFLYIP